MPHRPHFYESRFLDRAAHLRQDMDWLLQQLRAAETRILPVWRNHVLVAAEYGPVLAMTSTTEMEIDLNDAAFLGLYDDVPHFAVDLSGHDDPPLNDLGEFQDLRAVGPHLDADEGALAAYARGILHWHRRHRYCGACGSPTASVWAGHKRQCTNPDCGLDHFPRTDPAVIMLIHDGKDHALLARAPGWPEGRHAVLAGFVEPCETLEQAVAREVYEEVGIEITDIRYHSSQPWPFPSNIMLGFTARALSTDITLDREEIAEARWMTREELRNSPEDETFALPRRDSISYRLIEDWMKV